MNQISNGSNQSSAADKRWMRRAIQIADTPADSVLPNPRVGAVLVMDNQKIAEGFHSGPGNPHAEVECIENAKRKGFDDFRRATLYLSLEPCVHTKKRTPPCAPLLIEKKIGRIVVSHLDPNPKVSGRGIAALKAAGLEVEVGCLESEGLEINQAFVKCQQHKLPYLTMKLAMTFDGKMATDEGSSKWITNAYSRAQCHELRQKVQGILVGRGTIERDEPQLNVRIENAVQDRAVVILGKPSNLSSWAKKRKLSSEKFIMISKTRPKLEDCQWQKRGLSLKDDLKTLRKNSGLDHILIEGGPRLASTFLRERLVDELILYYGSGFVGGQAKYSIGYDWRLKKIKDSVKFRAHEASLVEGDLRVRGLLHVYRINQRRRKSS